MRANSEMGRKLRRRAAHYFLGMDIVRSRTERPNNVDLEPTYTHNAQAQARSLAPSFSRRISTPSRSLRCQHSPRRRLVPLSIPLVVLHLPYLHSYHPFSNRPQPGITCVERKFLVVMLLVGISVYKSPSSVLKPKMGSKLLLPLTGESPESRKMK